MNRRWRPRYPAALKGYDILVDHVACLADADEAVSGAAYNAILLDRQLPDGDGLTFIPKLRARGTTNAGDRAHRTRRLLPTASPG